MRLSRSSASRSAMRSGSAARPSSNRRRSTAKPSCTATLCQRSPKSPIETLSTASPGFRVLTRAASQPPEPAPGEDVDRLRRAEDLLQLRRYLRKEGAEGLAPVVQHGLGHGRRHLRRDGRGPRNHEQGLLHPHHLCASPSPKSKAPPPAGQTQRASRRLCQGRDLLPAVPPWFGNRSPAPRPGTRKTENSRPCRQGREFHSRRCHPDVGAGTAGHPLASAITGRTRPGHPRTLRGRNGSPRPPAFTCRRLSADRSGTLFPRHGAGFGWSIAPVFTRCNPL